MNQSLPELLLLMYQYYDIKHKLILASHYLLQIELQKKRVQVELMSYIVFDICAEENIIHIGIYNYNIHVSDKCTAEYIQFL